MSAQQSSYDCVFQVLQRSSFLGALPDHVIGHLIRGGSQKNYAKGQVIFWRGELGDTALIVLSGRLKVTNTTEQGHEIGLNFLAAGDIVGEIALLDGGVRTANVVALENSNVFTVHRRDLIPVLSAHPQAMQEIVEALCAKLRIATSIIEDSSLEMGARLAKGLLRLAHQHGTARKDQIRIELTLSQSELGYYVGLSRANVSRQLAQMKADGILSFEGSKIVVLDEGKLTNVATNEPMCRS